MADLKFSNLTAASSVNATDILCISQPASGGTSKSATAAQVATGGLGVTPTNTGKAFITLADPSAITFPKITAGNSVVAESAVTYRSSLGATTVGNAIFIISTPASVSWLKVTSIGGVVTEDAATTKTSLSLNNVTNDAQIKASDFPASSVDGEVSLFSGTTGKAQKRATGTGIAELTNGVLAIATPNVDYSNLIVNGPPNANDFAQFVDATHVQGVKFGMFVRTVMLTSGTSFTTANLGFTARSMYVECVGGGGGGGGAKATASNATGGGGGGGGGYSAAFVQNPAASYTIAIGAGGTAGAATGTNGGNGGITSMTGVTSAQGGGLGSGSATGATTAGFPAGGGAGGVGATGDFLGAGADGGVCLRLSGTVIVGGIGGASYFSGGQSGGGSSGAAGTAGMANTGQGGSGATSVSATGFAGGAGGTGVIRVTLFY